MPIEKHDLIHELPEYKDKIHSLKMKDKHFAKLFAEYHEIDHEIHRIETGVENTADDYLELRKKQRLQLKDVMFRQLRASTK